MLARGRVTGIDLSQLRAAPAPVQAAAKGTEPPAQPAPHASHAAHAAPGAQARDVREDTADPAVRWQADDPLSRGMQRVRAAT